MKNLLKILSSVFLFSCKSAQKMSTQEIEKTNIYNFSMKNIAGVEESLKKYEGKIVVIVNVASKCGLTPQYKSLEKFYENYKDKGVVVLGFPANNFLYQEPGTDEEIKSFCSLNYGVSFPMYSKISVKGKDQAPLYRYLCSATGDSVKWNFQKFVVNKKGKVVASISPKQTIDDPKSIALIESLLNEK